MVRRVKDKRRQTRRRNPMRGGLQPILPPCSNPRIQVNGTDTPAYPWHIKADVVHDGGAAILGYNSMQLSAIYGGVNTRLPAASKQPWDTLSLDEDFVRDELLASTLYTDRVARPSVNFLLRPATDQFTDDNGNAFVFDPFQRVEVAVFHDAGLPMFTRIPNARNAVGFGTPIDPAPKPNTEDTVIDDLVGPLRIPGCTFGFDPRVIGDIVLSSFTGNRVKVGVRMNIPGIDGGMQLYDGATGEIVASEADLTYKYINNPSGLFSGNGANGRMTGRPADIPYIVGKALGDALQVAACMPEIWTQAGAPMPKSWHGRNMGIRRILNTGDRLEYVRSVLMGVSCIYLGPKNKQTKARTGVFTPGADAIKSDAEIRVEYDTKLDSVLGTASDRWDACVVSIRRSFQEGPPPTFNPGYSRFGDTFYVNMANPYQVDAAIKFMDACKTVIEAARLRTLRYFSDEVARLRLAATSTADKIQGYSQLLSELDSHCPSGKILKATNMPQVFRVSNTETTEVTIKFLKGFENIKANRDWSPALIRIGYPQQGGERPRDASAIARARQAAAAEAEAAAKDAHAKDIAERALKNRADIRQNIAADIRSRIPGKKTLIDSCVEVFNAFSFTINAEQAAILGLRNGQVYYKDDSEISREWSATANAAIQLLDRVQLQALAVQSDNEVDRYYVNPSYAMIADAVGRSVTGEQNKNDFTDFIDWLRPDLVYPSYPVSEEFNPAEEASIHEAEKRVCKVVRYAMLILNKCSGRSDLFDETFHNTVFYQGKELLTMLDSAEDDLHGGGGRKTHRRRKLPKLL